MEKKEKNTMRDQTISRRSFLKGAGAAAASLAAMGLMGGYASASGEASGFASEEGARTVLAFASDQHGETAGFEQWLQDQKRVYGQDLAFLSYGGDICDKNWEPAVYEGFREVLDRLMPGRYCVTTGNQEHKKGAPVWEDLGTGFVRCGPVLETGRFSIYHFGAPSENMAFEEADIDALMEYMEKAPKNRPVFIVSHYPVHLSVPYTGHDIPGGYRQARNNGLLIDRLNEYPNAIFLWGHNHTFKDPRYGTIRPAGSKFTWNYADVTDKKEIRFIYANLGSFCRGDTYGCMAEVTQDGADVKVSMYYVDTDVPMDRERAEITFAEDGTVTCEVTKSDTTDYEDMFYLAAWYEDPSFEEDY